MFPFNIVSKCGSVQSDHIKLCPLYLVFPICRNSTWKIHEYTNKNDTKVIFSDMKRLNLGTDRSSFSDIIIKLNNKTNIIEGENLEAIFKEDE